MLSIVVPTLNEEDCLPLLLDSIKKKNSNFQYEIVVADAGSRDRTIEIARNYDCKIVSGGFPSKSKNEGAKFSRGDLILFLDADTVLIEDSLFKLLKEFKERQLDVASFSLKVNQRFHDISYNLFYNFPAFLTEKFLPQAMNTILVKKEVHQKIGGFDEEIRIGEELDYVRKGAKVGKFGVLKSAKILASPRRFSEDGWFSTWLKYFLCQIHMLTFGPVKSDILRYKFNHYSKNKKK